jgi:hypothetical protein
MCSPARVLCDDNWIAVGFTMNSVDAVLDRVRSLPRAGAEDVVCHTPQPIPPVVDDDDDDDDEDDDRGSGGGNIDPDDDEGGFDEDDDDDDEAPWTAVPRRPALRPVPE